MNLKQKLQGVRDAESDPLNMRQAAVARMKRLHLYLTGPGARTQIELPADVTILDDQAVGRLYGELSQLVAYTTTATSLAQINHAEATITCKRTRAQVMLRTAAAKQDDRRAEVELDPRVVDATNMELQTEAEFVLLQSILESTIVKKEAMSREISRRKDLIERKLR